MNGKEKTLIRAKNLIQIIQAMYPEEFYLLYDFVPKASHIGGKGFYSQLELHAAKSSESMERRHKDRFMRPSKPRWDEGSGEHKAISRIIRELAKNGIEAECDYKNGIFSVDTSQEGFDEAFNALFESYRERMDELSFPPQAVIEGDAENIFVPVELDGKAIAANAAVQTLTEAHKALMSRAAELGILAQVRESMRRADQSMASDRKAGIERY